MFENGSSDLTVHFDEIGKRFVVVQSVGFGPADVAVRAAPKLTGPRSAPRVVYRPPEYYRPNVMIYSAKAHPQLTGADLVLTYATNTFQFSEQLTDSLIYYPHFVRLARCRWGATVDSYADLPARCKRHQACCDNSTEDRHHHVSSTDAPFVRRTGQTSLSEAATPTSYC